MKWMTSRLPLKDGVKRVQFHPTSSLCVATKVVDSQISQVKHWAVLVPSTS